MPAPTAQRSRSRRPSPKQEEGHAFTRLVLVRHGVTETTGKVLPGRTAGLHLSKEGQDQAERLGMRLSGMDVAAVYASPLERTRETAAPISRACGVRTRTGQGLIECDFGDWTGQPLSKLRKRPEWEAVQKTPSMFRFPKGESFAEMQARMWSQLSTLANHHKGSTVVAVSHADTIKAAVAMASGTPLDLFQRYVISPCSATLLLFTGAGPVVLAVNTNGEGLGELRLS